jgi:hypothetical protein
MSACKGGYTAFPYAYTSSPSSSSVLDNKAASDRKCPHKFRFEPKPGSAILFYSLLPDGTGIYCIYIIIIIFNYIYIYIIGDVLSAHEACPVTSGIIYFIFIFSLYIVYVLYYIILHHI